MNYEVEAGGRRRTIEVRRHGQEWEVTANGRTMPVSVTAVEGWLSLLIGPPEGGPHDSDGSDIGAAFTPRRPGRALSLSKGGRPTKVYEISFEGRANGTRIVHVNGVAVPVSILDPRTRLRHRPGEVTSAGAGPRPIVAPMPGRIVRVLVKAGDVVAAQQGLVVVEAMKMENELRAPRAGTVTDVRVVDGMSVDANSVLMVME